MSALERIHNERGGYHFVPSVRPFSAGVLADDQHELVRAHVRAPATALREVLQSVIEERHGRPLAALCAVELRGHRPLSWAEFEAFNEGYVATLDDLGVTLNGANPVARTNVVPTIDPPAEQLIHAVCFTVPRTLPRQSYVVAGAAEVVGNTAEGTVRPGQTSIGALRAKVEFVLARMTERLAALKVERNELTTAHVYTARELPADLWADIGRATGDREGSFRVHLAQPPIEDLQFEMDIRSVASELQA